MPCPRLIAFAPLALAACAPLGPTQQSTPVAAFVDPALRAAQERACAEAVAEAQGVAPGGVVAQRTSIDGSNRAVVDVTAGAVSGYCRVDIDGRVIQIRI
jgi:hypothetical protein